MRVLTACALCRSTQPLVAACIRHAQALMGIDLSGCRGWLRVVEVHYQRPPATLSPGDTESSEARAAPPADLPPCHRRHGSPCGVAHARVVQRHAASMPW